MGRILVVDDERSMQDFLEILLARDGHEVVTVGSAPQAIAAVEGDEFDLVISDIRMPEMSGLELLGRIEELSPETPVVMITAHGSTETAVEAMKQGAYDYLSKPCPVDEIRLVVQKALEKRELSSENRLLRRQLRDQFSFPSIIGKSPEIEEVFELIRQVAPNRTNLLLSGESGTGKELVARAVHASSDRASRPFVTVNCGAIPENLLESELFGHVKGSFTGATSNKVGIFEVADRGTLLLDEVGDLPASLQVKLLRAIQDKSFRRVGGTRDQQVDVRIISATNRNLDEEVREGRFREDLYYRLNVIEIRIPAIRERRTDIPLLVRHFIQVYAETLGRPLSGIEPEALAVLERYDFPGNVRELENLIERAATLSRGTRITLESLPPLVRNATPTAPPASLQTPDAGLERLLADYERGILRDALRRADGVKKRAARLLGITFRSFRYRFEKLDLDREDDLS
ncbi:MAG: sigma-54-dependent Fis family transcriptional regulator [Myxococcales bacterium]|nr:sigma-54-dependent Fis family transcriptional regulator [Myxococcales bacterium]